MTKKEKIISVAALCALAVAAVLLIALLIFRKPASRVKNTVWFDYFDTVTTVYCYSNDSDTEFKQKCDAAREILSEYHKLSDIYNSYAGMNNLHTLNAHAGDGSDIKLDKKLIDMLVYAKEMHRLTNGDVNIAMGAVLKIWHEYREGGMALPAMSALCSAAEHCDIDCLIIDTAANTAKITDPEMSLDVGAIAKGYAAERAALLLTELGAEGYVLDVGSNLRMIGTHPTEDFWNIKIRNPDITAEKQYAASVDIKEGAAVTSGNYERYYIVDGKKYHHIINKDTLMPADFFASVSVIHKDSGFADAISTALFNRSYDDGLNLIKKAESAGYGELRVVWIQENGDILYYP